MDIKPTATATLPTLYGVFQLIIYKSIADNQEHAVLIKSGKTAKLMLVRIHSQCLTGDTFLSLKCDCREQLHQSMKTIQEKGSGIIIYLSQEGRGIGLTNKIKAYKLQEHGLDTVEANQALYLPTDARDYQIAAQILLDLGVRKIALLTNNPEKIVQLTKHGIQVVRRIPLEVKPSTVNKSYLLAKKKKLGHMITIKQ